MENTAELLDLQRKAAELKAALNELLDAYPPAPPPPKPPRAPGDARWGKSTKETLDARYERLVNFAREQKLNRWRTVARLWEDLSAVWWQMASTAERIVLAESRRYYHRGASGRYPLADLQQAARIGAYQAAQKWSPTGGASWDTYVGHGIRQALFIAIRSGAPHEVHIPTNQRTFIGQIAAARMDLERRGEKVTASSIAEMTGLTAKRVAELNAVTHIVEVDGYNGAGPQLVDELTPPCDETAEASRRIAAVREAIAELKDPREREVMRMRWIENRTLQEIADRYSLSRERVRQLENRAKDRLEEILLRKLGPDGVLV